MNHRFDLICVNRVLELIAVDQVALNEPGAVNDRRGMAFREVVVNHNLMPVVYQLLGYYASDIAGAAGHKYTHIETRLQDLED